MKAKTIRSRLGLMIVAFISLGFGPSANADPVEDVLFCFSDDSEASMPSSVPDHEALLACIQDNLPPTGLACEGVLIDVALSEPVVYRVEVNHQVGGFVAMEVERVFGWFKFKGESEDQSGYIYQMTGTAGSRCVSDSVIP